MEKVAANTVIIVTQLLRRAPKQTRHLQDVSSSTSVDKLKAGSTLTVFLEDSLRQEPVKAASSARSWHHQNPNVHF